MLLLAGANGSKARTQERPAAPSEDTAKEFSREWIVSVVESMDSKLDEKREIRILEECGRACARKKSIRAARESAGDLDKFLAVLRGWIGERNVHRDGNAIKLIYGACYCPNVRAVEKVPSSYCNCSRGWVKEMFETVVGKPCEVELVSSIKRGDKECMLVVRT